MGGESARRKSSAAHRCCLTAVRGKLTIRRADQNIIDEVAHYAARLQTGVDWQLYRPRSLMQLRRCKYRVDFDPV